MKEKSKAGDKGWAFLPSSKVVLLVVVGIALTIRLIRLPAGKEARVFTNTFLPINDMLSIELCI